VGLGSVLTSKNGGNQWVIRARLSKVNHSASHILHSCVCYTSRLLSFAPASSSILEPILVLLTLKSLAMCITSSHTPLSSGTPCLAIELLSGLSESSDRSAVTLALSYLSHLLLYLSMISTGLTLQSLS
jgi:hypothetical protein